MKLDGSTMELIQLDFGEFLETIASGHVCQHGSSEPRTCHEGSIAHFAKTISDWCCPYVWSTNQQVELLNGPNTGSHLEQHDL